MAVESVNNRNNAGYYALGGAAIGGGAGALIGHTTKSILKDGNYTDEFVKAVGDGMLNSDMGKFTVELMQVDEKSPNYLNQLFDVMKKYPKISGVNPDEISKEVLEDLEQSGYAEDVKKIMAGLQGGISEITGEAVTTGKDTNITDLIRKSVPKNLDNVFDRTKNEFISSVSEAKQDILEIAKKAKSNLKLKAAGIYGAIGAVVLGLGAYMFANSKSDDVKADDVKAVDTQA